MPKPLTARIAAVGGYLPEFVLTNQALEQLVDTNDAWIQERTGIVERRILKGKDQGSSVMGIAAAQQALEKAGLPATKVDVVICATVTPDMQFPATANLIQDAIGAVNAWSYDVEAACSSFLFALATGAQYIETGRAQNVLVVGADKMSSIIDYTDRTTCIIFGDGAGAVLLQPTEDGSGIRDWKFHTDGAGAAFLHQKAGGSRRPATLDTVRNREHFVYQEGRQVFKRAVQEMAQVSEDLLAQIGLSPNELDWFVPHQANLRIIEAARQRLGLPEEKVMLNIQRYGNTTSATLPLLLWDYEAHLKPGDNLLLAAFGGGFTWGALHLVW